MNLIDHQELKQEIEKYLLSYGDWIPAARLADRFGVSERKLRGEDSPIRSFTISSDLGYKSIIRATDSEFRHYTHRITRHAVQELRRVNFLKRRRISECQQVMEGV